MLNSYGLITGPIAAGKTKVLGNLILEFNKRGIPTYGFTELCIHKGNKRIGYDILMNMNGKKEQIPFVRLRDKVLSDGMIFQFDQKAVQKVSKIIQNSSYLKRPSLLIFDEYGRQESKLKGQWINIKKMIDYYKSNKIPFFPIFSA